jgi:predicted RNase H-like nuclease (RuvC/YqgF family)
MSLADMVAELEQDYDSLKQECYELEEKADALESTLDYERREREEYEDFWTWIDTVYPHIMNEYRAVLAIKEKSNGV